MTESERRARVVAQATAWLGLGESDGSHREILQVYNAIRPLPRGYAMQPSDPWCAAFVSAVGAACGYSARLYPECACGAMLRLYERAGRFVEDDAAVPAPGDVIFYDYEDSGRGDCRGEPDHVGLVTAVEGGVLEIIEGNRSDRVALRTLPLDAPTIRGYGKPDYASAAKSGTPGAASPAGAEIIGQPEGAADRGDGSEQSAPAAPAQSGTGGATCTVPLPVLSRGAKGESVRAAQLLLIGRGYRCGPWGADADFGRATEGGVLSFQRGRRLAVDGIVGPETWRALLGVTSQSP